MINSDWKLVKKFEELRPNLIFKLIDCKQCTKTHQGVIGNRVSDPTGYNERGFRTLWPFCDDAHDFIGEWAVQEKRVFILLNDIQLNDDEEDLRTEEFVAKTIHSKDKVVELIVPIALT